jgi:hypothetical protein
VVTWIGIVRYAGTDADPKKKEGRTTGLLHQDFNF